ncbi:MAG TPA: lysylphosphatidylglycerol synthase transmembrane domain-containing protein [Oscillatoriaceae cyanobacterium]
MRAKDWGKLIFSAGVLALVLGLGHPERIWAAISAANLTWMAAALAAWAGIQGLNVLRWWILSRAQGLALGFGILLRLYFVGMFFNTFLPSGFGGDVVRGYELSRRIKGGNAIVSVASDRFVALYALLLLACAALFLAPADFRLVPPWGAAIGLLGATIAPWMLWAGLPWLESLAVGKNWSKLSGLFKQVREGSKALRASPRAVVASLLVALLCQALGIFMHYLLIRALGLPVPLGYLIVFFPILSLAASLPISINGIGVREGGFLFFLGRIGVSSSGAVALGILSFAMLLLSSACGAALYALERRTETPVLEGS